ncbi:MAG: phosphonate C-P lyase system protein PhnH [Candidatus Rokuibacteriota bacterium]
MLPGLADPTLDSQRIFRSALEAISRPGRIVEVTAAIHAPVPLHPATAALCLALLDFDTPLWLDDTAARPEVVEWLKFHCSVRRAGEPDAACFVLVADAERMPALSAFDAGTAEYPNRSATLIVQVRSLIGGTGRRLTGPGIAGAAHLDVVGVPEAFWTWVSANHALFPRGVDIFLSAGQVIAALPRTTRVED